MLSFFYLQVRSPLKRQTDTKQHAKNSAILEISPLDDLSTGHGILYLLFLRRYRWFPSGYPLPLPSLKNHFQGWHPHESTHRPG